MSLSELDISQAKESEETKELLILKYRKEIVKKIRENSVIIITGQTGCGKTTKVPQFILDDAESRKESCKILVSQPRKIAAITVANRIAKERKCMIGSRVGYQVGLHKKVDKNTHLTQILFCTTGVILQKIVHGQGMEGFTHIILDEIHERGIDTDLLITIMKMQMFDGTSDAKIILMSATINVDRFVKYFSYRSNEEYLPFDDRQIQRVLSTSTVSTVKPQVVKIQPQQSDFTTEIKYLNHLQHLGAKLDIPKMPSIPDDVFSLAAKIVVYFLREYDQSVLLFLPGIYEIESAHAVLRTCTELNEICMLCVLHSSLSASEQQEVFTPATLPKVILSTNIAESSVTIPNIGCVIDFCLTKSIVTGCENSSLSSLKLEWTTKHSCIQRAGRTGRVCNGKVYRMVARSFYNGFIEEIQPEMLRAPLETTILRVKQLDCEAPHLFLAQSMSAPEKSKIFKTIMNLKEIGALTLNGADEKFNPIDGEITFAGRIMAVLPLDVRIAKLVALGYMFSVLSDTIVIAAGLTIKNLFKNHFNQKMFDYTQKLYWANGSSCDSIAILNAYRFWQHAKERGDIRKREEEEKFCDKFNFERKALHEMRQLINELESRLEDLIITSPRESIWNEKEKHFILKLCIAGAFIPNYFMQRDTNEVDERDVSKILCGKDHNRTVYFRKMERDCIGELYEDQIKQHLVAEGIADSSENIELAFDSCKILVTFSNTESMIDDENYRCDAQKIRKDTLFPSIIPKEVYKSVFFRKIQFNRNKLPGRRFAAFNPLNSSIELKVLSGKFEEDDYAVEQGLGEIVGGVFKRKKNLISEPIKCILPSYNTKSLIGIITHVEHCNKFYFQPHNGAEIYLEELLTKFTFEDFTAVEEPKVGMLVVIKHNGEHKRAKIVEIAYGKSADCFIIDYGYTIEVPINDLLILTPDKMQKYFLISERCLDCTLTEITPNFIRCPRGKWTLESIYVFRQLVLNQQCEIDVYSVFNDKVSVTLYVNGVNVNEYMIQKQFAKKIKEPYMSIINHNEREQIQFTGNWISREDEFAEKESNLIKTKVKAPSMDDCRKIVKVEGPFSPLETSICQITLRRQGSVSVNQLSVNHIVLNDCLGDCCGKLLVAAEILTNSVEDSLTMHNVTAMPAINGLPAVLAMIFAPSATFYRDRAGDIVQLRFGLGPFKGKLSEDCSLPINFAVEEDIEDVNELRILLSYLYNEALSIKNVDLKNFKPAEIKNFVLKIFNKERPQIRLQTDSKNSILGKWNINEDFNLILQRSTLEKIYEPSKTSL